MNGTVPLTENEQADNDLIMKIKPLKLTLLLGAALATMNLSALADSQVFKPLQSKAELSALQPGTQVAHECPHCGAITVSKADKEHSQAAGFTCPVCKMSVTYRDTGGGKG